MDPVICTTCAVEHDPENLPEVCAICADERQYVPRGGQSWTSLADLRSGGHRIAVTEIESGLWGLRAEPGVGIGQTSLLARTPHGNLLWDVPGYIDDDAIASVRELGGIAAIATSHPHMFGLQREWSAAFDGVPVYVSRRDAGWVQRWVPGMREWDGRIEPLPQCSLVRVGGHFAGSAVALWRGEDGAGVLLAGDTVATVPAAGWVSFLRSYPNRLPLSAAVVTRIAEQVGHLAFERLYDNFAGAVDTDAAAAVQRSAQRYVEHVRGDHDADT